jgi:hypothetical protein
LSRSFGVSALFDGFSWAAPSRKTIVLFGLALLLAELTRWFRHRGVTKLRPVVERLGLALLAVLLVAVPYYLLNWREVITYIFTNTGAGKDAALWHVPGGITGALYMRLRGYPMDLSFGEFSRLLAFWLIAGLAIALARRDWSTLQFVVSGAILSATSLLITSAGQMGVDLFFSFTWEIILVVITWYAVAKLANRVASFSASAPSSSVASGSEAENVTVLRMRSRAFPDLQSSSLGALLVPIFAAMLVFTFYKARPARNVWEVFSDTAHGTSTSLNERLVEEISARTARKALGKPATVFVTFMGKVNAASQQWIALKRNLAINFQDLHRSGVLQEQEAALEQADFVEIADPQSQWLDRWLPSANLQASLLELVRKTGRKLTEVSGAQGKVYLFEN